MVRAIGGIKIKIMYTDYNKVLEQGRIESQIPLSELGGDGFWEWLNAQPTAPKQSPYKPTVTVKVGKGMQISTLRDLGHKYFDMIWRDLKLVERNQLYVYLSEWLGVPEPKAHFTFLNPAQCIEAIEFSIQKINDNRREDLDLIGIEPTPFYDLIIN